MQILEEANIGRTGKRGGGGGGALSGGAPRGRGRAGAPATAAAACSTARCHAGLLARTAAWRAGPSWKVAMLSKALACCRPAAWGPAPAPAAAHPPWATRPARPLAPPQSAPPYPSAAAAPSRVSPASLTWWSSTRRRRCARCRAAPAPHTLCSPRPRVQRPQQWASAWAAVPAFFGGAAASPPAGRPGTFDAVAACPAAAAPCCRRPHGLLPSRPPSPARRWSPPHWCRWPTAALSRCIWWGTRCSCPQR